MKNEVVENKEDNFLVAEYNALQERANLHENIRSSRINFFLLLVAAIGTLLGGISNTPLKKNFNEIILFSSAFLALIGLATLWDIMTYSGAIVDFYRRAARIRRWFLNHNPNIEKYIPFEANDDKPKFYSNITLINWRGAEPVLLIINSFCITFLICSSLKILFLNIEMIMLLLIGTFIFFLTFFIQLLWIRYILNYWEKSEIKQGIIHFPSTK